MGATERRMAGMAANAIAVRRAVVAHERWRVGGWWAALVVIASSLVFAVDGVWVAAALVGAIGAAVTWVVGAWVLPGTRDAYVRRVSRGWNRWAVDTRLAYGRYLNRHAKFADDVAQLSPPPELVAEHERLVAVAREHAGLLVQPRTVTFARDVTAAQKKLREARESLVREARSERYAVYVASLERLFATQAEEYALAAAVSERATAEAAQRLARIKPPGSVAAQHAALTAAVAAHLDVVHAFHQASGTADADRVVEAAARWQTSVARAREAFQHVASQLGFYERWPVLPESEPSL